MSSLGFFLAIFGGEQFPNVDTQESQITLSLHFNGHFPGEPGLAGISMSPLWILSELRLAEVVVTTGAVQTCKDPVKQSPPTNHHQLFTGRMPFLSPNQQCQSTLKGKDSQTTLFTKTEYNTNQPKKGTREKPFDRVRREQYSRPFQTSLRCSCVWKLYGTLAANACMEGTTAQHTHH